MTISMMTPHEIEKAHVNPEVAREAFNQASKRLADILDTKKVFEQKAFALFSGYLTVSIALLGVAGAIYKSHGFTRMVIAFLIAGGMLVAGAVCFVLALTDKHFGVEGSNPEVWLNKGTIDGGDTVLPRMLAYITYYHQHRIKESIKANNSKASLIHRGIWLGITTPIVLVILLIVIG
jgi:hypothetical protein